MLINSGDYMTDINWRGVTLPDKPRDRKASLTSRRQQGMTTQGISNVSALVWVKTCF